MGKGLCFSKASQLFISDSGASELLSVETKHTKTYSGGDASRMYTTNGCPCYQYWRGDSYHLQHQRENADACDPKKTPSTEDPKICDDGKEHHQSENPSCAVTNYC